MRLSLITVAAAFMGVSGVSHESITSRQSQRVERVVPNDNRQGAGRLRAGELTLRLEARLAMWHPDGDSAPGALIPAFAESGGPARIPGPLVRVRSGTGVNVSVTNTLADTLVVHGLYARTGGAPGAPLIIPPRESRNAQFRLDAPGTYHYWGTTTGRALDFRTLEDAQLTGAIVVDDAASARRNDRVFVIGQWTDTVHRARTTRHRVLGVINGRSWPNTERLDHVAGDTVRWRIINASGDLHPMHLHGFYFRVHRRGDGNRETTANDLVVTESMGAGGTIALTWVPERAGNWLFHCHIPEHFAPRGPLGLPLPANDAADDAHANHATGGMSGLVMGIAVQSREPTVAAAGGASRNIRLLVRPRRGNTSSAPSYSYAFHERGPEPDADAISGAPTLDLTRGQPVRIMIVNRLPEATAVHWHGIELESYYDGVPGFSGAGRRLTPLIAPGDSFDVRFTPPRAGTFIYHTHASEERQQLAGLAGAIVVSEPGYPRDPARDIPIVATQRTPHGAPILVIDGNAEARELQLVAGIPYRLRLIQIATDYSVLRLELYRNGEYARWRPLAKDGAELAGRRMAEVSRIRIGIGEALDVEVTPDAGAAFHFEVKPGLRYPLPAPLLTTVPVRVVPPA
ncbi:MAG TPA: multicopper oxidase domain-containing protein [Gemmatimonadaceae bacterium]|nr:multicopper oxidase domain-containing protein [Gemmatimonadaceae bacterium]